MTAITTTRLAGEELVDLADACEFFPRDATGRTVHTNTVRRWVKTGLYGCRLEAVMRGNRLMVSRESCERFQAALERAAGLVPA